MSCVGKGLHSLEDIWKLGHMQPRGQEGSSHLFWHRAARDNFCDQPD